MYHVCMMNALETYHGCDILEGRPCFSDGILFAADTEKAFDSVNHNFICATLNKFK